MSLVSKKKSQFGREMSMSVNICKYFSPPSHTHPSANIWKVAKFLGRRNGRILYCVHPNTCQDWFGDNVEPDRIFPLYEPHPGSATATTATSRTIWRQKKKESLVRTSHMPTPPALYGNFSLLPCSVSISC